jgi:hypothetical protein
MTVVHDVQNETMTQSCRIRTEQDNYPPNRAPEKGWHLKLPFGYQLYHSQAEYFE